MNVAIFGGDSRVHGLAGRYGDNFVSTYESSEKDAGRLATSLRQGTFQCLVLLTRWMGHANYTKLKNAAGAASARVVHWSKALGALEDTLPSLLESTERTSDDYAAEEEIRNKARNVELPPVQIRARDAGMTVACYEERHGDCVYAGKAEVKCGCACHPITTEEQLRIAEEERADAEFTLTFDDVLQAMETIDKSECRVSDIAELIKAATPHQHGVVRERVNEMIAAGLLAHAEDNHVKLMPKEKPQAPKVEEQELYVVKDNTSISAIFCDRGAALDEWAARRGRDPKLYRLKEVKVRVKYEVEE